MGSQLIYPEVSDRLHQIDDQPVTEEEIQLYYRTHPHTYEVMWNCDFLIFGDAKLFARPLSVAVQVVKGPEYRCDCRLRRGDPIRYFCYTLSGCGAVIDGSGSYRIAPGQAFLVETDNPQTSYFYPEEKTAPWRFLAFAFHGLQAHVMVRAMLEKYGPVYELPVESRIIQRLLGYEGPHYSPGMTHVHQVQLHEATELVLDFLMSLSASKQIGRGDRSQDLVQAAVTMLTTDPDTALSVNEVALRLDVTREHLSRVFQARLGKSLRTFMLEQKIHRACLLLKETDTPIKEIAERLGYSAYSNFSAAFFQVMNATPREFRLRGIPGHSATLLAPQHSGRLPVFNRGSSNHQAG